MLYRIYQVQGRWKMSFEVWNRLGTLTGWRKSAFINTVLVSTVLLVLLTCHVILWAKSGSVTGYQIIHSGKCAGNAVGRLNTITHLMINILSSLVLASTNFFMQVLNAPSREELDSAHEKGSWLDIGVPSPRNVFKVSRFKRIMWILFFLSSVPIHLLFNSAIFATDRRESTFSYFVFDESVRNGVPAFDPGTKLAIPSPRYDREIQFDYYTSNWYNARWQNSTAIYREREGYFNSGHHNRAVIIQETVEAIRKGNWHRLDKEMCSSLYNTTHCAGLRTYSNVALILSGFSGWNRSQVWNLSANESSYWDTYVPSDVNNSLWFAYVSSSSLIPCQMWSQSSRDETGLHVYCNNNCDAQMGLDDTGFDSWTYSLFPSLREYSYNPELRFISTPPGPAFEKAQLSAEYCFAEPIETICQIGLASTLLWVVSLW